MGPSKSWPRPETGEEELLWLAIWIGDVWPDVDMCPELGGRSWFGVVASRGGDIGSLLIFMLDWWLVLMDRVEAELDRLLERRISSMVSPSSS